MLFFSQWLSSLVSPVPPSLVYLNPTAVSMKVAWGTDLYSWDLSSQSSTHTAHLLEVPWWPVLFKDQAVKESLSWTLYCLYHPNRSAGRNTCLKSLKSMLGLNFSSSSRPCLNALSSCHVIGWFALTVEQVNLIKKARECHWNSSLHYLRLQLILPDNRKQKYYPSILFEDWCFHVFLKLLL